MPELPEVETIRRGLESSIVGQVISSIDILLPKMFIGSADVVLHHKILSVGRRGKLLMIKTSAGFSLLIHLKMTGQLIFSPMSSETLLPNKSTKVIFTFSSGDRLFFNDFRTFGYVQVFEDKRLSEHPFLKKVGVEPLEERFTVEYFFGLLDNSRRMNMKAFLLDQTKVAGIGNIYADESLFSAKIMPTRAVGSLSLRERNALYESIKAVLTKGVDLRGSSHISYVDVTGERGVFLHEANVYQRDGLPCRVCGRPISKMRLVGRGTHYCTFCQK